ncbi:TerD family protein [Streptomyces sp. DSM 42041]|uniref:TerD family protein n=1 Tax=Streptomyces hazeniae TaxID=3075538 RepID=A0ABU2NNL9_9ACTN|nr:TerD family protein [Streptomyces sp. DSM 42041]MDT0378052.1 TerD family protein [Streptomyces sp. DSM 42041]
MSRQFQRGHKARISDLTAGTDLYVGVQITGPGLGFDISCFGLDAQERLADDRYFVFFNQPKSPEESVQLLGAQAGDTESFRVTLDRIPAQIQKLSFTATVDGAGQMSQIAPGYLRIVAGGEEVARYAFDGSEFTTERAVMLGDFYLKDVWRFAAVGQGFDGGLDALLRHFGGEVLEEEPAGTGAAPGTAPGFAPPGAPAQAAPGFAPPPGQAAPPAPAPAPPPAQPEPAFGAPQTPAQPPFGQQPPAPPAQPGPPGGPGWQPGESFAAPAAPPPAAAPPAQGVPAPAPPPFGQHPPGPPGQPTVPGQTMGNPFAAAQPPAAAAQPVPQTPPPGLGTALEKYREAATGRRWTLQNEELARVDLGVDGQPVLARQGSMVLYQGKVDFSYKGAGFKGRVVGNATGQEMQLMRCTGGGQVFFAESASHLHPIELQGDAICVSAENVLAFDESLHHEVRRIEGHGIPGGALFTMQFQGTGTVVVRTQGTPVVLPVTPTTFADADAVVAWSAGAQVIVSSQVRLRRQVYGGQSGETVNLQFRGAPGNFIVVQPCEV